VAGVKAADVGCNPLQPRVVGVLGVVGQKAGWIARNNADPHLRACGIDPLQQCEQPTSEESGPAGQ